jgi:hypothetical protein
VFDAAYNLTFTVGSFGFGRAVRRTAYAVLVGDRGQPGLVRAAVAICVGGEYRTILPRFGPALRGNALGALRLAKGQRLSFYDS